MQCKDKKEEITKIVGEIKRLIDKKNEDPSEIAILTRKNADGKEIEKELILKKIPYELAANKKCFLDQKEVNLALSYLNILFKPFDNYAWG